MPLAAKTDTAALIPGARVEIVEEAGHYPWLERRDTGAETVDGGAHLAWRSTVAGVFPQP